MARSWQQPRWRRILMQIAMVGVLGATVGVAALVDRHRREMRRVALDKPTACGPIWVQLPLGATITKSSEEPGLLTATIAQPYPAEREVMVTVATPAETGLLEKLFEARKPDRVEQDIPFGTDGSKGRLYLWTGEIPDGMEATTVVEVIATARVGEKSGSASQVTIRSKSIGAGEDIQVQLERDVEMVKEIAASVVRQEETAEIE